MTLIARLIPVLYAAAIASPMCVGMQDAAVMPAEEIEKLIESVPMPKLWIGAEAPAVEVVEWVRGEGPKSDGEVWVVDFWATWCIPCIREFPTMSELHARDGVSVFAINVWENGHKAANAKRIRSFVDEQGERMEFAVGIDQDRETSKAWIRAAGQNSLPVTFVIDREGRIAWFGPPTEVDVVVDQVIRGSWDAQVQAEVIERTYRLRRVYENVMSLLGEAESVERGYAIARGLMTVELGRDVTILGDLAYYAGTGKRVDRGDIEFAIEAAEFVDHSLTDDDPVQLYTLARVYSEAKRLQDAVAAQRRAVDAAVSDEMREEYAKKLAEYEAAAH